MKLVYFDCFNGAAGDMILGALIDAGVPETEITGALRALGLGEVLTIDGVRKGPIRATKVHVDAGNGGAARGYRTIVDLIDSSQLAPRVKQRALRAFERLGEAEATIHGIAIDEVHLHEVGAIDAIVDIVGACAAIEYLEPERIVASAIPTGRGFVTTEHGSIPLPAPAVTELLRDAILFERGSEELITPTGAALLASWCDSFGEMPPLRIHSVGYGAGTRDTATPNVLRVLIGEQVATPSPGTRVELLETNVDDMAPELLPYVIERLMGAGALDAWVTPIVMKKGRQAMTLSVLCDPTITKTLLDVVFAETSTLGVRIGPIDREVLDRKEVEIEVEGHRLRVKLGIRHGRIVTVAPEYEDAAAVARASGLPLKDVYDLARRSVPPEGAL